MKERRLAQVMVDRVTFHL